MNQALVDALVDAVMYEGYILYPYRASAKKNRQRFTYGRVYPEAYSAAQKGAEPCVMQTECLVERRSPEAALDVRVRFLHPMVRQVGEQTAEGDIRVLPELCVEGETFQTWHEAVEREVLAPSLPLVAAAPMRSLPFTFDASRATEPIRDSQGRVAGLIVRRQEALAGLVEIATQAVDDRVFRVTVRVINRTPVRDADLSDPDAILLRTFASTHTILRVEGGEFLSLMDPPASHAQAAAACANIGAWPILVGDEARNERDAMISSPIILYDYPKIAPESAGDLFDAAEIDEILSLRILTMTDEEKREMRGVDERARQILERTEALPQDDLLGMHGAVRSLRPLDEDFFNPAAKLESVAHRGMRIQKGSRVRLHPRGRADVLDIALAGKTAVVEALERDAEDQIHLAVVLDDDPGKDLGMLRQPGHRFFYGLDEVEPIGGGA